MMKIPSVIYHSNDNSHGLLHNKRIAVVALKIKNN